MTTLQRPTREVVLRTLSHELNTALTIVLGNIRILGSGGGEIDGATRQTAFHDLEEQAERLHLAIQNLLLMERLGIGEQPLLEPVVLSRLLEQIVITECRRGGCHEIVNEGTRVDPVSIDRELFKVVLTNLVDNACLYSPPGMRVWVRTSQDETHALVTVLDEGPGLDEQELFLIFEPYYRSSSRVPAVIPGLGIGLTVAKKI